MKTRGSQGIFAMVFGLTALALASLSRGSDHLDTAAVRADPAADIGDLYAWTDHERLNLVMTIVGGKFSDHVSYEFHVDSGRALGATAATITIACVFDSAFAPQCSAGEIDRARGDASGEAGLESEQRHFRVFAGLRDDPFFNNVRGTRAALNVAGESLAAGVPADQGGCPRFGAATAARIRDEWHHTEGRAGENFLAGWRTAALVVSVDLEIVNRGGPLLGVWSSTSVRPTPPNHPPLEAGVLIDRMGRALTGNALLGTFDSEEASDALKTSYNQTPREAWSAFAKDIARNLAIYDGFDGVCGNQWLSVQNAPPATRYEDLARMLADDRLWVNSAAGACRQYLAAEYDYVGATNQDCGGRTPDYDAVDVFRSLLALGRITGIDDGVSSDDRRHSASRFPFLAPPSITGN